MKSGVGKKGSVFSKLVVSFLALIILFTPPLAGSDSWSMFFHDPQHTGNTTSTAPNTNVTLWSRTVIGGDYSSYSSPAVANGRIFVNAGGLLYCLNENNGTEIWNRSIGYGGWTCSTPAIANGMVYGVGDKVYCFYENNGTEVWNKPVFGSPGTSSPIVAEGRVFVNTGDLYCIYANNGTEIWSKGMGGSDYTTPAVSNGKLFHNNGGRLYCFHANNGSEIWNITGDGEGSSPAVSNNKVFYNPSYIKCLYDNNGTEIWNHSNGGSVYSSPAIANGKIFVNTGDALTQINSTIYCYYESNGTEIWNVTIDGVGCSTAAVSNDGKVFVNGGGYIYCLDENNGEVIWNKSTGGPGYSSPAIANGRAYVNEGIIYCFGSPSLKIDYIMVEDDAHNELTTVYLNIGESITVYAAGYNATTSTFAGYVEVNWSEDGGLGSFDPQIGSSTTYTAGQTIGVTNITGENLVFGLSDDFIAEIISSMILKQGWNLISVPLIQQEQNLTKVFASIDGLYDAAQWYNITDTGDPWKHYKIGKPYGNDLSKINEMMGIWIHIIQPEDTIFYYNGILPTTNQTITLHQGWNLVGYPSLKSYNRTEGLNNLTFGIHVDSIWTFNAAIQKWHEIGPSDYFEIGGGYWVHAKTKCIWEVLV